ncbi:MAG TPA: OB-fold nucleic acid binding domain-containing protein, partial [Bacteroidales bacterium]
MPDIFETNIMYLKGVGPKKAELLQKELGIETYGDMLNYFPFRYVDKSKIYKVNEVTTDTTYFQLKGKVTNLRMIGEKRVKYITAELSDETGTIELVWFKGLKWVKDRFAPNQEYIIFGKPSVFKNHFNFVHPEVEDVVEEDLLISGQRLEGIYSSTEKLKNFGLGSRGISTLIKRLSNQVGESIRESLPEYLVKEYHLIDRKTALLNIHFPETVEIIDKAVYRLKFEELLLIHLQILQQKIDLKEKSVGHVFGKVGNYFNDFFSKHLPFELTNAQKRVIKEIRADFNSGKQMNRLLQGDVG